jgi:hypothetical protein
LGLGSWGLIDETISKRFLVGLPVFSLIVSAIPLSSRRKRTITRRINPETPGKSAL